MMLGVVLFAIIRQIARRFCVEVCNHLDYAEAV